MISVQISLQDPVFIFFRHTPGSGIAGSQSSSSIFDFLRNLCTFLHSRCIFYSPAHRASIILISLHPHQHSLFCLLFFDSNHLNGCEGVSHCGFDLHFPNHVHIEHCFMCLLAICISSLEKCLFKSFTYFFYNQVSYFVIAL